MSFTVKTAENPGGQEPPKYKGGLPWFGSMFEFATHPYRFAMKVAAEVGEVAAFKLLGQRIIMLTGDKASEVFYRSSDEELDQSAAYKLMTPMFGEGLVFDAPLDKKDQQLKMIMPSLRMEAMRSHSFKIVQEVEDLIENWGNNGEIELVSTMTQLTINTASHCLLGREFRYELTDEFAEIYHDLEKGVNPLAFHFPYLPIPSFKRRDKARARLQALIEEIIQRRKSQEEKPDDMFQSFIDAEYTDGTKLDANEITGLLVGAIFAGHHTSSGTAAWVLLELLKHPRLMKDVKEELDELLGSDGEVTFQSLREMPKLENVLKEVLRLHPPLIILMRQVSKDLHFKNYTFKEGDMVWAVPPVTHRLEQHFKNPEIFDPDRFDKDRKEDKNLMAYQPFGGGKHKCSGNAFALFQIKAIFAILLRRYDFELVNAPDSYQDDYKEMIVQPKPPCQIRYKRRDPESFSSKFGKSEQANAQQCPMHAAKEEKPAEKVTKVVVDMGLCQGHAVCMGEAPEHFEVGDDSILTITKAVIDTNDEEDMAKVKKAVEFCPNSALKIVEE
jgi:sterol 14-demethylase